MDGRDVRADAEGERGLGFFVLSYVLQSCSHRCAVIGDTEDAEYSV
jgi:hypothetical protein